MPDRVDRLRVDPVASDGLRHHLGLDLALLGEGGQDGHDHVAGVDLEEPTQRLPGVGAAHAVRAEGDEVAIGQEAGTSCEP